MIGGFQSGPFQLAYQQVVQQTQEQNSGGWFFHSAYEELARARRRKRKEEEEREEEAQQIQDKLDREIAVLIRKQEAIDERKAYLERLGNLAKANVDLEAARRYSDRVAKAYERAVTQGNFSALEALDRELQRAQEEEDLLLQALLMFESDD